MVASTAEAAVRLLLTGVLCLVPTVAYLGLLRLLDRFRSDVLVEHTMRMAAVEETSEASGDDWEDPGRARRLVLCSDCATLRSPRPGRCPTCGASLEEVADRPVLDRGPRGS